MYCVCKKFCVKFKCKVAVPSFFVTRSKTHMSRRAKDHGHADIYCAANGLEIHCILRDLSSLNFECAVLKNSISKTRIFIAKLHVGRHSCRIYVMPQPQAQSPNLPPYTQFCNKQCLVSNIWTRLILVKSKSPNFKQICHSDQILVTFVTQ